MRNLWRSVCQPGPVPRTLSSPRLPPIFPMHPMRFGFHQRGTPTRSLLFPQNTRNNFFQKFPSKKKIIILISRRQAPKRSHGKLYIYAKRATIQQRPAKISSSINAVTRFCTNRISKWPKIYHANSAIAPFYPPTVLPSIRPTMTATWLLNFSAISVASM